MLYSGCWISIRTGQEEAYCAKAKDLLTPSQCIFSLVCKKQEAKGLHAYGSKPLYVAHTFIFFRD